MTSPCTQMCGEQFDRSVKPSFNPGAAPSPAGAGCTPLLVCTATIQKAPPLRPAHFGSHSWLKLANHAVWSHAGLVLPSSVCDMNGRGPICDTPWCTADRAGGAVPGNRPQEATTKSTGRVPWLQRVGPASQEAHPQLEAAPMAGMRGASAIRRPSSTSSGLPASRHPTLRRSPTTTDGRAEQNEWPRPRPHRGLRAVRRARRSRVATGCQRPPGLLVRPCRPTLREPLFVLLVLYSFPPPPLQELASGRHRVDDGDALSVFDHTNLQRFTSSRRPNEHRDRRIVGLEGSPVMSNCVGHVIVVDAVLSCCGLDVHDNRLRQVEPSVTIC